MTDEYDDAPYDDDDDVPFDLPKAEGYRSIHKEDTEELVLPKEGDHSGGDAVADDTERPQPTRGMGIAAGLEPPSDEAWDDDDVPFHLPHSDELDSPGQTDAPIAAKLLTMPSAAIPDSQPTVPNRAGYANAGHAQRTVRSTPAPRPTVPSLPPVRPAYPRPPQVPAPQPRPSAQKPVPKPPSQSGEKWRLRPKRQRRRLLPNVGCLALFLGALLTFCGGTTLIAVGGGIYGYIRVGDLLNQRLDELEEYTNFQSTYFYDRNGVELYEAFSEGRRANVGIEQIPQALIDATIAIEDDSFYSNVGIDIPATVVAILNYLGAESGEQTPGGSTITQQLVRNVLFSPEYRAERSIKRKTEEILLAIALTARKSKDDILQLYLNEIYYGNLAYGAQAAAQVFFGKDVSQLTLGEAALLAGLPQAPADLDPLNPDPTVQAAVHTRWREVLDEMVEEGFITEAERTQAIRDGLQFVSPDVPLNAPHFTVYAQNQFETLMRDLGYTPGQIARGGFYVYTTADLRINDLAQQVAREQVQSLSAAHNISNAAVIVIKPVTGEILAMVGSIDYNNEAIDGHVNVTTAFRQPGSTMKPFTYSSAIENGLTPGDVIWDTRTSIGVPGQPAYVPRNYDGAFHGPMIMRYALGNSYNIPAVQTLRSIGPEGVQYLLNLMQRFGVESLGTDASRYGLSLTLGGGEISLLELTRAYTVFTNQGVLVDTTAILCILDNEDNILYQYEDGCPRGTITPDTVLRVGLGTQVLDPRVAFLISDILSDNDARSAAMGSNSALYTPGILTSVKTGTTNDVKDNWTVGYTHNVAVGVWVGNNNGDPMVNTSGLIGAAPIWNRVITAIYHDGGLLAEFAIDNQLRPDQLQAPDGMSLQQICNVRVLRDPAPTCPSMVTEWFLNSPAALPDGQGGLYYPPPVNQPPDPVPNSGSYVQQYSPGIYRTVVATLAPEVANAIQFDVPPGQRPPPSPRYCRVPVELIATTPGVQELLFIAPPPVPADAAEAEEWARSHGLAFLPTIDCTPELVSSSAAWADNSLFQSALAGNFPAPRFTAYITSPSPNQVLSGAVPITGTADFPPDQAQYYVFEIIGGPFGEWTRIQEPHYNSIIDGQMETLYPPAQSGAYLLRLLIVDWNHNIAQQPYVVQFFVP